MTSTEIYFIRLSFGWIAFCILHSLFASLAVKNVVAACIGKIPRYYRLVYSAGSLVFLFFLLQYQIKEKETVLFKENQALQIASIMLILVGLAIMLSSAYRYFIPVTGLSIFTKRKTGELLAESGIHGIIRHPLYAGTLLFIWGLFLMFAFPGTLITCSIITIYTYIGIKYEEKKLLLQFGEQYRNYRRRVPMIIPKLPSREILNLKKSFGNK
jgi:methanethiol S-methyltransferase